MKWKVGARWWGAGIGVLVALGTGALVPHNAGTMNALSLGVSVLGLALSVAAFSRRAGWGRWLRVSWAVLGAFSFVAALNFFDGYFGSRAHTTDFFHYYLGARYQPQLQYDGLYLCTAAVLLDLDKSHRDFDLRDIEHDDSVRPMSAQLEEIRACRARFDDAEWKLFAADVKTFVFFTPPSTFQLILSDHGYNASPVWTAWARTLIRLAGNTADSALKLQWLDNAFVLAMGGLILWAFGAATFGVSGVFFLAHVPSASVWTLGSLSRFDWLLLLVAGFVALKKRRPALAGAAWALAASFRVFPMVLFFGAAVTLFSRRGTRAGRSQQLLRVFIGAAVAGILALSVGTFAVGTSAWSGWKSNLDRHARGTSANLLGLSALASYREGTRLEDFDLHSNAFEPLWRQARIEAQADRQGWVIAGWLIALAVFLFGRQRGTPRENAAVSIGLIPVFFSLSGYYMSALLGLVLGARNRRVVTACVAAAALGSQLLRVALTGAQPDAQFFAYGIVDVALVFAVMAISSFLPWRGFALKNASTPTKELS